MKNDFFALFLTNNLLKKRLTNNENLGAGKKALGVGLVLDIVEGATALAVDRLGVHWQGALVVRDEIAHIVSTLLLR